MTSPRRVVITGLGVVSPLGLNLKDTWDGIKNGNSGVGPITLFEIGDLQIKIAAELKDFDAADFVGHKKARRRDRFENMASAAAKEALEDSGLEITDSNTGRIGSLISSAVGGMNSYSNAVLTIDKRGARTISPFAIPNIMANGAAGIVGIDHGIKGPTFSVTSACASGADGIGNAFRLIQSGLIDAALAGGSEATVTKLAIAAFDRIQAASRKDGSPPETPSPFSRDRDGMVMGEGAAVLVLEDLEHAKKRGANIVGELVGYSATADAYHVTAPAADGAGGAAAIIQALEMAQVNVADVDYINAHGTGTQLNDSTETIAIKKAMGEHAYNVPISSTKSMTGHMISATGALEAVFCVKAIQDNVVPPTINYHEADPDCDLDYVPNEAREIPIKTAFTNSFGFGGHNAVLVFSEFAG